MSQALIKRMREQRMQWVDLGDGKSVRIIRPSEVEVSTDLVADGTVRVEHPQLVKFTVDWKGFSEADLLGPTVGTFDPLAFDQDLWAEYSRDRAAICTTVASAILNAVVDHHNATTASAKN